MCAIVAVLRRPSRRTPPSRHEVERGLDRAASLLAPERGGLGNEADLAQAAETLEAVDRLLSGVPGVRTLLDTPGLAGEVRRKVDHLSRLVDQIEESLAGSSGLEPGGLALPNSRLTRLRDVTWALGRNRLGTAEGVRQLAGEGAGPAAIEAFTSVQVALAALNRLEVRGRDSAGIHILVGNHALDLTDPDRRRLLEERAADDLFGSGSVRAPLGHLAFVYKAAAEVGELGDNVLRLRRAMQSDELLHEALAAPGAEAVVLAHTRWASVGIVSEANAHPHNAEEYQDRSGPYVAAALNGDIDNHVELRSAGSLKFPAEITSDSKVAPTLISRLLAGGTDAVEAFRATVDRFEGSVAIAAHAACEPGNLFLAVRGSGQGLHVGLAEDAFVVASEPYGLVEQTSRYVRIDGEATSASGATGQVLILDQSEAGSLGGIRRMSYDGTDLPLSEVDVRGAEITTRDIDLGGFRHYLLKEISESPRSLATTLRGRIVERDGLLSVELGDDVLPPDLRSRLASGAIVSIAVIGQGTAAVAGQAMAASLAKLLASSAVSAVAVSAAELSGFALTDDMSDTLVVAISQSGTTTDTNRTVDLARARGAGVIGIVNRRGSDLAERCHGVLYTSDGRDVEMSVASTKAFYAQVAAGALLALGLARETGDVTGRPRRGEAAGAAGTAAGAAEEHELLTGLLALPAAMERLLSRRQEVALAAQHAPGRRHWAVVGSGLDRIAAQEVRIKLSELCYQSISCDAIEDKKHIDLSSEPLIFVCAAGLLGANADDVSKETAIYRAHKAMPIVVATEGQRQFDGAVHTIEVPSVHPDLAFVLSAMAGHLFAYEAALAIDAQARVLREARGAVEEAISGNGDLGAGDQLLERLGPVISPPAERFLTSVASGALDGCLDAGLALRLASLLRCAAGIVPLEIYESERGRAATPGVLIDDLTAALTDGIEMLSRPIDAIKHQAKTVTVGISRSEERLFQGTLVSQVLAAGVARGALGYRSLRTLAALDPAVVEVNGYTRYHIDGGVGDAPATIGVVDKGGVAATLASRTATDPTLRGTKNRAVSEREVTVARGARDGRTVVLIPETKGNHVQGLTLLHVTFADRLAPEVARAVLSGYRNRYGALVDAVSETESRFDDERLSRVATIELLVEPVAILASHWRG